MMKVPSVVMFVIVTSLVAGLTPVLNAFWPTATVWWSAALVVILGSLAAGVQAWKEVNAAKAASVISPEGAMSMSAPEVKKPKFLKLWIIG